MPKVETFSILSVSYLTFLTLTCPYHIQMCIELLENARLHEGHVLRLSFFSNA